MFQNYAHRSPPTSNGPICASTAAKRWCTFNYCTGWTCTTALHYYNDKLQWELDTRIMLPFGSYLRQCDYLDRNQKIYFVGCFLPFSFSLFLPATLVPFLSPSFPRLEVEIPIQLRDLWEGRTTSAASHQTHHVLRSKYIKRPQTHFLCTLEPMERWLQMSSYFCWTKSKNWSKWGCFWILYVTACEVTLVITDTNRCSYLLTV